MRNHIIRKIQFTHCKKGPANCEMCRKNNREDICLLKLYPPNTDNVQRRMIQATVDGEEKWWEYEVVRSFTDEREARYFAQQHGITDIRL